MNRAPDTDPSLSPVSGEIDVSDDLHGVSARPLSSADFPPTETDGWQWAKDLKAEVAAARAEATAARGEAARARRRWGWLIAVGSLLSAMIAPVSVYAGKKLLASERAHGAADERDLQRVDDHRLLYQLRDSVAEIRGELRALNPVGALRMQGPARPDPQDAP